MYMSSLFSDYPISCLNAPPFWDKYHRAIFSAVSSEIETTRDVFPRWTSEERQHLLSLSYRTFRKGCLSYVDFCIKRCYPHISNGATHTYQTVLPTHIKRCYPYISNGATHTYQTVLPTHIKRCYPHISNGATHTYLTVLTHIYQTVLPTHIKRCYPHISNGATHTYQTVLPIHIKNFYLFSHPRL